MYLIFVASKLTFTKNIAKNLDTVLPEDKCCTEINNNYNNNNVVITTYRKRFPFYNNGVIKNRRRLS
jgi:hypothetical protein